ncbi:MAG: TIM barrel protein [Akkermansia sp.]|nr:TIM barrel protein [Akkermansia sp.]
MNVFSTCWNSHRHTDGGTMCDEIRELGFDTIEVSHGLPLSMLPGVIKAVDAGRIRVAGVHNFCPAPIEVKGDVPDAYRFTSHREGDRERAMRLTEETLMTAERLGARYVVLHMGSVELCRGHDSTRELERMARHGLISTREYARRKGDIVRRRARLAPLYFERARVALHRLAEKAEKRGLVLGVEGRSHLEQMPGEEEMLRLMQEFDTVPSVRYWHDFGHIQRKHNLLLLNHEQYLRRLQPWLYGAHVNDVAWPARDHREPFYHRGGDVDFERLLPQFFTQDMPLSWELSRSVPAERIRTSLERWNEVMARCAPTAAQAE